MTTIMHKHGGIHEWDLTLPEVHEAIYASLKHPGELRSLLTDSEVVQRGNSGVRTDYSGCEISNSVYL